MVEDDDLILKQLKKMQAQTSIWGMLMASHMYRQVVLDAFNGLDIY